MDTNFGLIFFFLYLQDPSNLQGKVQKHQAFEAELSANQSRIDALEKAGQKLIDVNHYASDEVAARMNEVISLWKKLLEATELKGKTCLQEYRQHFSQRVQLGEDEEVS